MTEAAPLCRLEDIPDHEARGFEVETASGETADILIVRKGKAAFAYLNRCPHARTPLNWVADRFMTLDRKCLLCATHGAEFRIEDGRCLAGPCLGQSLTPIRIALAGGVIRLAERPDVAP